MTQTGSPADTSLIERTEIVIAGLWKMAEPFLVIAALVLVGFLLVQGYKVMIKRMDAKVLLRAEQAAARSRVERRKNAQARNLEEYLRTR